MAFDATLADRIRRRLGKRSGLIEKKMFGGLAFLLNGNMCCGIHGNEMIVRLDPAQTDSALAKPDTRVFDITGRPMKGWILIAPKALATDAELGNWIEIATRYASSLPGK